MQKNKKTMKKFYLIIILLANISLTSFAQNGYYESEISSFGDYDMSGKTFYILSGNANISNKDLEFIQYRDIIAQCMIRKHAIPTNDQDMADVCILMDYGITDKSYIANYSAPTWGISGIILSSTSTSIGLGYLTTTTTQTNGHSFGLTGLGVQSKKVPEFRRVLNLYAYDNQDRTDEPVMLWKTHISSDGSTNDLQAVFPYLAEAAITYIGNTSNEKKFRSVQEDNIEVYLMKNRYYLNKDATFFHPFLVEKSNIPMYIHSMLTENDITRINLLAKYSPQQLLTTPKFKKSTYIIYNGEKYPIIAAYLPCETGFWNHLENNISLQPSRTKLIQIVFPIKLEKGESFDIVSYSNKKETKKFIEYEHIIY